MWENLAISVTVFLPLVGAGVILLIPKRSEESAKPVALLVSLVGFVLSLAILAGYYLGDVRAPGEQLAYQVNVPWITAIGANYHVGIDGISLPLFVLSYLLTFLCAIYAYHHIEEPGRPRAFLALMLLLQTGMAGCFIAFDLVLFFVFWELVLVPMYFMIGVWGGPRREYAAVKFFLYTLFGSVFMLVAFLALYFTAPQPTFDILTLAQYGAAGEFAGTFGRLAFLGIFLGFAIKVPMWPFHTWLPDAHTEAPTIGSVLLAGILLKMGTYGFVRIALPILPEAAVEFAPIIAVLAVIAIIYGALCCLAQTDLKRLIAFSSVGHMGFVMLGIATLTPTGINAAIFGMIAHGVITGMLFFVTGSLKERYHTRTIAEIGGGMMQVMPRMGFVLGFVAIASLGLPGLAGFWGEVFALLAAFSPAQAIIDAGYLPLFRVLMVLGAVGTVLTAGYFLWMMQRVLMGQAPERWSGADLTDITAVEWAAWTPLLILVGALGVLPFLVFGITNPDVVAYLGALAG
ncbi:MAG TPA: NADH-quinone oxidoreductase subunit M [Egibacteraceae bacterium]|jgi:NADH-quinone oxidoreductase subunit M|nr:NADH-quinone oxidoreductase subunit M [Egibacteraceae bacterium]